MGRIANALRDRVEDTAPLIHLQADMRAVADKVEALETAYRKAETALLEMNQLAVDAPYQHDETWVVPADSIAEVFERWATDDE